MVFFKVGNDLPNNASGEDLSGNRTVSVAQDSSAESKNKTGLDINITLHLVSIFKNKE
jgi:hypothetical protein